MCAFLNKPIEKSQQCHTIVSIDLLEDPSTIIVFVNFTVEGFSILDRALHRFDPVKLRTL